MSHSWCDIQAVIRLQGCKRDKNITSLNKNANNIFSVVKPYNFVHNSYTYFIKENFPQESLKWSIFFAYIQNSACSSVYGMQICFARKSI